ncbi:MAG TPA: hypothetical protein VD999_04195 [Vitreimonas sp.]|nr:hypothetical protein [Vitreimonas sp.]
MSQSSHDSGSFITGFTLGMFAGAAGYFLFGTKRGEKLKKELSKEWQKASENWQESGAAQTGTATIREMARQVFEWLTTEGQKMSEEMDKAQQKSKTTTKTKKNSTPSKEKKFKGL